MRRWFYIQDVESGKYSILANINNTLITIREVEISGKDVALGDIEIEGVYRVSDEISVIDVTDLASMGNENDNFSSGCCRYRECHCI